MDEVKLERKNPLIPANKPVGLGDLNAAMRWSPSPAATCWICGPSW